METIKKYLKDKGLHPSYQRVKIYQYLQETKIHPSVEDVYKALYKEIPTLSKTTVYSTLKQFGENNIVTLLHIDEKELRCDPQTHKHAHIQCMHCGKIEDINIQPGHILSYIPKHFKIYEHHMYLKGICGECRAKEENQHSTSF